MTNGTLKKKRVYRRLRTIERMGKAKRQPDEHFHQGKSFRQYLFGFIRRVRL